jgi:hypothetical protein
LVVVVCAVDAPEMETMTPAAPVGTGWPTCEVGKVSVGLSRWMTERTCLDGGERGDDVGLGVRAVVILSAYLGWEVAKEAGRVSCICV